MPRKHKRQERDCPNLGLAPQMAKAEAAAAITKEAT